MSDTQKTNTKIGIGEKFCFLLTNIGNIPLMVLLSMFLTFFYTEVVGLDAGAVATLFLLSKVVDGISDPVMGYLMDRVKPTKMGRFRPMLIMGTIICSINYVLVWFGPAWAPGAKIAIAYISYLALGITFDIMDISLNSMLPLMTDDLKTRDQLSTIKMFGYMGGAMALSIIGPMIVADGQISSYYKLIFGALFIVVVFSISGALGIHERVKAAPDNAEKYSFFDLMKIICVRPVLVFFVINLVTNTATMVQSGVNTYYYSFMMADKGGLAIMSFISIITLFGQIPGMLLSGVFSAKLGKKKTYIIGAVIFVLGVLLRIVDPTGLPILYAASVIASFGSGIQSPLNYGIQADNTNYVEYKTNRHAEAAIASTSSFVTKCAQGLGGAIPLYILKAFGYIEQAPEQAASVNTGILASLIYLPAILFVVAIAVMAIGYNIDKKQLDTMNEALIEKHAKEAAM